MKPMKVKILGWLIMSAILVVASCKKDDTPEVDPLVGTYAFSSATFNETVYITIQDVEVEFLADSDATQFVGPGLLSAAPCANAQNAAIRRCHERPLLLGRQRLRGGMQSKWSGQQGCRCEQKQEEEDDDD